MARLLTIFLVLVVGLGGSIAVLQYPGARQSAQPPGEPVRISDLGLEDRIPSAIDLVGPRDGPAGRKRAALVNRLQCWIDGTEGCSVADRNDPRVRAVRRFLALGPDDRDGVVTVHFPDRTRIVVRVARIPDLEPDDWDRRVYEPVVVPETAQGPDLPAVPSSPGEFEGFSHEGTPEIDAALERLKQRFE